MVLRGLKWAPKWVPRGLSIPNTSTRREILLNETEIRLYLPCTDWFGTANGRPSVCCSKSIGTYMVNSIWFDSIIFTKDFSVCSSVWDAQASRDKGNLFRSPPQYHIAGGFLRGDFRGTTNGSPWCGEVVGSPVAVSLMNFPVLVIDRRRVRKWSSTRCFLKNFQVFIWLVPITMVTVYYVTMVMLYAYYFRCVYPVLLIHKST